METIYDWATVGIFAGLIVLFLQRSVDAAPVRDSMWHYLAASVGCAVVNWLGNRGDHVAALILLLGVLTFIWYMLKPLEGWSGKP
jgi:hypothetical protein